MLTPVLAVCMLGAFDVWSVGSLDVTPTAMVAIKGVLYLGTASGDVVQADLGEVPPVIATTATGAGIFAMAHVVVDDDTQYLVVSPANSQYGIRIHPLNTTDGSLQAPRMMELSRNVSSLSVVGQVLVVAECETYEAVSFRCLSPSIISTYLLAVSPLTARIWPSLFVSFTTDNFAVRSREPGIERNGLVYFGGRSLSTTWGAVVAVNVASGSVHSVLEEAVGRDTEPWIAFAGDQLLCAAYHKWAYINVFSMQFSGFGEFQYAADLMALTRLFSIDVVGEFVYLSGRTQGLLRVPLTLLHISQSVAPSMQSAVVLSGDLTALLEDMGVFYCVIVGAAKTTVEAYAVSPPSAQPDTLAPSTLVPEADQCTSSLLQNPDFLIEDGRLVYGDGGVGAMCAGNFTGWQASHGTPSASAGLGENVTLLDRSIFMWSYSSKGEGVVAKAQFSAKVRYRATLMIQAPVHEGDFYVKIANDVTYGGTAPPVVTSEQTVFTSKLMFPDAVQIGFSFTADADYSQLWIYPFWTDTDMQTQAEVRIDTIMVCLDSDTMPPMTASPPSVVPTATPVTDPPQTKPPVTKAPETLPPTTDAPKTSPPATSTPTTDAANTTLPTTDAPLTDAPATDAPPNTNTPATDAANITLPTTNEPVLATDAPEAPETLPPTTDAATTSTPTTDLNRTDAPETETPDTQAPVTDSPPTSAPPTCTVGPVLANPSFEHLVSGRSVVMGFADVDAWRNTSGTPTVTTPGIHGECGVLLADNDAVAADAGFVAGATYQVTLWVQPEAGYGTLSVALLGTDTAQQTVYTETPPQNNATETSFTFTADATYTELQLRAAGDTAFVLQVDDIRVCTLATASSAPATTATPSTSKPTQRPPSEDWTTEQAPLSVVHLVVGLAVLAACAVIVAFKYCTQAGRGDGGADSDGDVEAKNLVHDLGPTPTCVGDSTVDDGTELLHMSQPETSLWSTAD